MKLPIKNKYIFVCLSIFILFLMSYCSKDLGNYKYNDINELEIINLKEQYAVISDVDTLHISPSFISSRNIQSPDNYEFRWVIRTDVIGADTIGREAILNYPIKESIGNYQIQLRIRDKYSGVVYSKSANLLVSTPYTRGILLIGETVDGTPEAEMLSMIRDTLHIKDIIKNSGISENVNGVLQLLYAGGYDETHKLVWLLTSGGSYYLDRKTMRYTAGSKLSNFLLPTDPINVSKESAVDIAPQIKNNQGEVGNDFSKVILTSSGNIYSAFTLLGSGYFYNPVNKILSNPDELLPAAPYLIYAINNMSSILWLDTKNNRFMYLPGLLGVDYSVYPIDKEEDIFSWDLAKDNKTLIYAENTVNSDGGFSAGNSFAIVRSKENSSNIYKFNVSAGNPIKLANYEVKPIAQYFDKAEQYAFSSKRTVVFYTYRNTLYAYDYNPGNEKFYQIDEFKGKYVSMIKFDTQQQSIINSLYIATYEEGSAGTLERFNMEDNPNTIKLLPVNNAKWTRLLKIKNINWKPE